MKNFSRFSFFLITCLLVRNVFADVAVPKTAADQQKTVITTTKKVVVGKKNITAKSKIPPQTVTSSKVVMPSKVVQGQSKKIAEPKAPGRFERIEPPKATEEQNKNLAGLDEYPAVTTLSKKALNLQVGMSRLEVFELLGKPSWVELQQDGKALVWSWDNDVCNPITVTFNKKLRVVGFDQGRIKCLKVKFNYKPEKEYLCSQEENAALCSATSDLLSDVGIQPPEMPLSNNDASNVEANTTEKNIKQLPPVEEGKVINVEQETKL